MNDHLSNPIPSSYDERLLAEVRHDDFDLTAIIGIDCPRGIENTDLMLDGKPASGPYLGFVSFRELDADCGRYQDGFKWRNSDFGLNGCKEVHSRRSFGGVCRKGQVIDVPTNATDVDFNVL